MVAFCDWLLFLSVMFSVSIHVGACVRTSFRFMVASYPIVWMGHVLFIHSPVHGHLGVPSFRRVCDFDCFLSGEQLREGGGGSSPGTCSWGWNPQVSAVMLAHLSAWPGSPLDSETLADVWEESWPFCGDMASRRAWGPWKPLSPFQ